MAYNALRGFPEMRVYDLKRLYNDLEFRDRMPVTEVPLLMALIKHVGPHATEEDIQYALICRGRPSSTNQEIPPELTRRVPNGGVSKLRGICAAHYRWIRI